MTRYFVMVRNGDGTPSVMIDDSENVALFDSEDDAEHAGETNLLGEAFGYKVYPWK